ncbi:uncharacterized protein V6R79_009380 [Siganus canaliculatus]
MAVIRLILGLFLFLSVKLADSSDVVGHEPVNATVGEDVVLPCHLEPPFNVSTLTVEWTRDDLTVHVYKDRKHDHPQDEQFRGRTSLFREEMGKGNISLKLSSVRLEDSGLYICYVPKLQSQVKKGNVSLTVLLKVYPQDDAAVRDTGGNKTTKDDDKQSGVQTGAIVGGVGGVVIVIILVLLVLGCKHKDRLKTWRNERWGRNQENDPQREPPNNEEENRLNPGPGPIPQGADPVELDHLNPNPDQNRQDADAQ